MIKLKIINIVKAFNERKQIKVNEAEARQSVIRTSLLSCGVPIEVIDANLASLCPILDEKLALEVQDELNANADDFVTVIPEEVSQVSLDEAIETAVPGEPTAQ